jgi:hypothetical protein
VNIETPQEAIKDRLSSTTLIGKWQSGNMTNEEEGLAFVVCICACLPKTKVVTYHSPGAINVSIRL